VIPPGEVRAAWPAEIARARGERGGLGAAAGRALLLLAVPLCLVWLPVGNVPGAGNVTASDLTLAALWGLCAWSLATRGLSKVAIEPAALPLLALAIGLLAAVGSELSTSTGRGPFEFFLLLKRFGLAAVLPLAATLFRSPAMGRRMRSVALLSLAALAVFALVPSLQTVLPRPPAFDASESGPRATGLLTNPNDLAYTAVALAVLYGAFFPRRPRLRDRLLLVAALSASGACLVLAASRSGLLGAASALAVVLLSRRIAARTKVTLLLASTAVVVVGLALGGTFERRVARAYEEGRRDENVSSRLHAQRIALLASMRHPLGVGFTGYVAATSGMTRTYTPLGSDSVYFDTLLGAGVLGLLALLALLGTAFRHIRRAAPKGGLRGLVLRAGMVAFAVFGTASIIPMAVALSPLFFSIVAAASYPDEVGPSGAGGFAFTSPARWSPG